MISTPFDAAGKQTSTKRPEKTRAETRKTNTNNKIKQTTEYDYHGSQLRFVVD